MTIRNAKPGEGEAVLEFYHRLIDLLRDKPWRPTWIKGVYPTRADLDRAIEEERLLVALDEAGAVMGAVIRTKQQGEGYEKAAWQIPAEPEQVTVIHLLAADPLRHRQGIGTGLLERVRDLARAEGDRVIRLDVLPWNAPARGLYERFGFRFCGEVPLDYPSTGTIPFCMYEYDLRP